MKSVFYPMGFPVEIETNSEPVLAAASSLWARYPQLADARPVRLKIAVSGSARATPPPATPSRVVFNADRMSIDHDTAGVAQANYATADLNIGSGEVFLTPDRAADSEYVNYHFLEPIICLLLAPRHYAFAHASCIARNGRALVLCGDTKVGKTCLAYACARKGWTFLSGDATHFLHRDEEFSVAGRPFSIRFRESARELFPELGAWPASLRPNGRMSIEADSERLNVSTAFRGRASHLVFLERQPGTVARLEPMSPEDAIQRLEESVFFGGEDVREGQRATLRRFARLPSIRLVYSDSREAEPALRSLIPDVA